MHAFLKSFLCMALLAIGAAACTAPETPKDTTLKTTVAAFNTDSIATSIALAEEASWQTARSVMMPQVGQNAQYLVNGFQVPVQDLKGILAAYEDGANSSPDSIFAMLAIRGTNTTLIFHVKDRKTGKTVYYDFSRPCPPVCDE
jgi:hypothetical protein